MSKRIFGIFAAIATVAALLSVSAAFPQADAQSATAAPTMAAMSNMPALTKATALTLSAEDGLPKGIVLADWDKAFGVAEMVMGTTGNDTIAIYAGGLVPNGVYTIWWVNMKPSMSMGPLTKPDNNSFKADTKGYGNLTFTVPSKNDYQAIFVVYHADGKTHGTDPGKMGSESYTHLTGEFPGPGGMSMTMGGGADAGMATMAPTMAK